MNSNMLTYLHACYISSLRELILWLSTVIKTLAHKICRTDIAASSLNKRHKQKINSIKPVMIMLNI